MKRLPRVELVCKHCKVAFLRTTTEAKRTNTPFCSRDCYFKSAANDRTRGGTLVDRKYAAPALGTVFGLLTTVTEEYTHGPTAKHYVDVVCGCEKQERFSTLVAGLYRGSSTSCGCSRSRYPVAGKVYNRFTVSGNYKWRTTSSGGRQLLFEVLCSCGSPAKYVTGSLVVSGRIKSCDCLRIESISKLSISYEEYAKNIVWQNVTRKKDRYGEITLTRDQMWDITQGNCFYCGIPPSRLQKLKSREPVLLNGIDRVDTKGGYTPDNVVTCCWPCNRAKATLSPEQFIELATRIVKHTERKTVGKTVCTST